MSISIKNELLGQAIYIHDCFYVYHQIPQKENNFLIIYLFFSSWT